MLIDIATDDTRVPYWGSLKYVERLRSMATEHPLFPDFCSKNIVVRILGEQGHFGGVSDVENLALLVWEFAWLETVMFRSKPVY